MTKLMRSDEAYIKFTKDLKDGNIGERIIANYLKTKYGFSINSFNHNKLYDFILEKNQKLSKWEVKTDCWEHFHNRETNNMFLEVTDNGKKSGVMSCEADFFVYYYPYHQKLYIIRIDELKNLMKERPNLFVRQGDSGDNGRVVGFTINRFETEQYFKVLDIERNKHIFKD